MRLLAQIILIALFVPLAAIGQDEADEEDRLPDNVQELSPEVVERWFRELEEQRRSFARPPLHGGPEQNKREYSGEWIEEDGSRYCDGYLTRNVNEEYCSKEIPDDWRSFEFNGETYFVAPIEDKQ